MHGAPFDHPPGRRLWLFSGTGDGPPLAQALLAQGWELRVSVVTPSAARVYPAAPQLELRVGPLGGADRLQAALAAAQGAGQPFRAVIDATHPFAMRVHGELQAGCAQAGVPLLVLQRGETAIPPPAPGLQPTWLDTLEALAQLELGGERLLLAIGARHLARAVSLCPGAVPHARVLPRPGALQQALAAGVPPEHVACLLPGAGPGVGAVEAALVRQWGITVILARQAGPPSETLWRRVAAAEGCRLLLLRQPNSRQQVQGHSRAQLLALLAAWGR